MTVMKASDMKVLWQVTGSCKDAYTNASRIKVEDDKKVKERREYIHPKLY